MNLRIGHLIVLLLSVVLFNFSIAQELPQLVVSAGHHQRIRSIDISPDDKYIASGADDNMVKVFDLKMQREIYSFGSHAGNVKHVQFSPDNNYLISVSDREILVHTHPEGQLLQKISLNIKPGDKDIHVTRDFKLIYGDGKGTHLFDLKTGKLERLYENIISRKFAITSDEQFLIGSFNYNRDSIGVAKYDLKTGERVAFYPVPKRYIEMYTLSPDDKTLVLESNPGKLRFIDLESGSVSEPIDASAGKLTILKFDPKGKEFVTAGFDNKLIFWDPKTGKKNREILDLSPTEGVVSMSMFTQSIDFSSSGKEIAAAYTDLTDGVQLFTVEWFNRKEMRSIGKHEGEVQIALSLSLDHTGKMLNIGTISGEPGVKCISLIDGNQKKFIPGAAYHGTGGEFLCAFNNNNYKAPKLEIYHQPDLVLAHSFDLFGFAMATLSSSGKYAGAIDQKPVPPEVEGGYPSIIPYVRVWDVEQKKEIVRIQKELLDMPTTMSFSPDEKYAVLIYTKKIELIDLQKGEIVQTHAVDINYYNAAPIATDKPLILNTEGNKIFGINYFDGTKEEVLNIGENVLSIGAAVSSDGKLIATSCFDFGDQPTHRVRVFDWETKTMLFDLPGQTNFIRQIVFSPDGNHIFSVDDNGLVSMWDIEKRKLKGHFMGQGKNDLIIVTPEGYYKSNKTNVNQLAFRKNGVLYTFDQFDLRYNRPDIVLASIGFSPEGLIESYYKAFLKRIQHAGYTESELGENFEVPELAISNLDDIPLETEAEYIDVKLRSTDANQTLDRINVWINEVPLYGVHGISLDGRKLTEIDTTLKLELSDGVNHVEITTANASGSESFKQSFYVRYTGKAHNSHLHFIGLGVSEYLDETMDLQFASKDIQDLASFYSSDNIHFSTVQIDTFLNGSVQKGVLKKLEDQLKNTSIHDQVIIMFSGHGVLDDEMNYYLASHNIDFRNPGENGIPYESLDALLDGIPARKKLLLIDACHSGEIDPTENVIAEVPKEAAYVQEQLTGKGDLLSIVMSKGNSFEMMKDVFADLRKSSGAVVIASSSGKYFSYEDEQYQNGIFTYALKQGMAGDADTNKDDEISVSEMKNYLYEKVQELTNGKQQPTTRQENLEFDFRLY